MTNVVSQEKRRANRRNARFSTGPATPEGKRRSSQNAIRHGLLSKNVVLKTTYSREKEADFDQLVADFVQQLQPQNVLEETLVERIATCYWRLHRAQQFETGSIRDLADIPDSDDLALAALKKKLEDHTLYLEWLEKLLSIFDKPNDQLTPDEAKEKKELVEDITSSPLFKTLHRDAKPAELPTHIRNFQNQRIADAQDKIDTLQDQVDRSEADADLRHRRKSLIASIPAEQNLDHLIRYESMIDRQMHRALSQLHRIRQVTSHDTPK